MIQDGEHILALVRTRLSELLREGYECASLRVEDDTIVVSLDSLEGVDMDYCAELNRTLRASLPQLDDYNVEVGSVSITEPFASPLQYRKHVGAEVLVFTRERQKLRGTLTSAEAETFTLTTREKEAVEGKKKKVLVERTRTFHYDEVESTQLELKV